MQYPLISVIIPVYNTQDYLNRCIGSILRNTYTNLEVICIDDGSTDESLLILEKWAEQDSRVKVITINHSGLSTARNIGIENSVGELVGFIDSDDWVHKQYFELLLKGIKDYQLDISVCERIITKNNSETESEIDIEKQAFQLLSIEDFTRNQCVKTYIWGRLFKRRLLSSFPVNIDFFEDKIFNFEIRENNTELRIGYTQCVAYYHYNREGSLANTVTDERRYRITTYFLRCFCECVKNTNSFGIKIYFEDAIKYVLSFRYITRNKEKWVRRNKRITHKALYCLLMSGKTVPKVKKFYYYIFLKFPDIYTIFRFFSDREYTVLWKSLIEKKKYFDAE